MPLGVVSDDEFEAELSRIKTPTAEVVDKPSKGRNEGDNNVPTSIQQIIGDTAITDGRQQAVKLGEFLGISPSSVSAYSAGASSTATYNEKKPELVKNLNKTKGRLAKSAASRLKLALDSLTENKFEVATAREISGVARDMAAVMKDMSTNENGADATKQMPQFIIYAPQLRQENHFEMIHVEE